MTIHCGRRIRQVQDGFAKWEDCIEQDANLCKERIEHCNGQRRPATGLATVTGSATGHGLGDRNGLGDRPRAKATGHGLIDHDSTYARAHLCTTKQSSLTVPVILMPVSNRPHRDEDDGLTHKVKIGTETHRFESASFGCTKLAS